MAGPRQLSEMPAVIMNVSGNLSMMHQQKRMKILTKGSNNNDRQHHHGELQYDEHKNVNVVCNLIINSEKIIAEA